MAEQKRDWTPIGIVAASVVGSLGLVLAFMAIVGNASPPKALGWYSEVQAFLGFLGSVMKPTLVLLGFFAVVAAYVWLWKLVYRRAERTALKAVERAQADQIANYV